MLFILLSGKVVKIWQESNTGIWQNTLETRNVKLLSNRTCLHTLWVTWITIHPPTRSTCVAASRYGPSLKGGGIWMTGGGAGVQFEVDSTCLPAWQRVSRGSTVLCSDIAHTADLNRWEHNMVQEWISHHLWFHIHRLRLRAHYKVRIALIFWA